MSADLAATSPVFRERATALGRIALGVIFLVAGIQKVGHPIEFSQTLANYDLLAPTLEMPAAIIVPRLEILIGLCLIGGLFVPAAATLSVVVSVGFGVFVGGALFRGLDVECGCFSGAGRVSWLHLGLDFVLLALAVATLVLGPDRWSLEQRWLQRTGTLPRWAAICGFLTLVVVSCPVMYEEGRFTRSPLFFATPDGPSLGFDPPELNLGKLQDGETVERTVVYRNNGNSPISIVWVQSSCRCTVPQPGKRTLAPGESGELKVQYKASSSRKNPDQTIKVYQRGNQTPAILKVKAEV